MSTKLETRRDYLVRLGFAKPGRGKFSNAAKDALAKADAEGIEFLDGPSPKGNGSGPIKSTVPVKDTEPVPAKVDPTFTPYLTPDEYRFPEKEYRGIVYHNGKRCEVSLRECCNTCRVSLVNHMCESPTILGGIAVKIERR